MYPGYLSCGMDDPFAAGMETTEIINNPRAYAYMRWAALPWLIPCDECDGVEAITSRGQGFLSPILDPAPWYDINNPDSWGFLGVLGLEITGGSDSTRQASVSMSVTGKGVIGRTYFGPRTMVVRTLILAKDECSLEFGMTWLREACSVQMHPCGGDPLTFFDCCPCICPDEDVPDPCWPDIYFELEFFPLCDTDPCDRGWVETYAELDTGEGTNTTLFPTWATTYAELEVGPADAQCWSTSYQQVIDGPPCTANVCNDWVATYGELDTGEGTDPELFPVWAATYDQLNSGAPGSSCWPVDYAMLITGPPCSAAAPGGPSWWAETYQELIDGPPDDVDDWCDWPDNYFELATGPPPFSCCVDACLGPYMKQFHNARITEGPTILRRPAMTCGAMLEAEFTIVAGDPEPHTMPLDSTGGVIGSFDDELISDSPLAPPVDPFALVGV